MEELVIHTVTGVVALDSLVRTSVYGERRPDQGCPPSIIVSFHVHMFYRMTHVLSHAVSVILLEILNENNKKLENIKNMCKESFFWYLFLYMWTSTCELKTPSVRPGWMP